MSPEIPHSDLPVAIQAALDEPRRRAFRRLNHPIMGEAFLVDDYQVAFRRALDVLNGLVPDDSISTLEWLSVVQTPCGPAVVFALARELFVPGRPPDSLAAVVDPDADFETFQSFQLNCADVLGQMHAELASRGSFWEGADIPSQAAEVQSQFRLSEIEITDWGLEVGLVRERDRVRAVMAYAADGDVSVLDVDF